MEDLLGDNQNLFGDLVVDSEYRRDEPTNKQAKVVANNETNKKSKLISRIKIKQQVKPKK